MWSTELEREVLLEELCYILGKDTLSSAYYWFNPVNDPKKRLKFVD